MQGGSNLPPAFGLLISRRFSKPDKACLLLRDMAISDNEHGARNQSRHRDALNQRGKCCAHGRRIRRCPAGCKRRHGGRGLDAAELIVINQLLDHLQTNGMSNKQRNL